MPEKKRKGGSMNETLKLIIFCVLALAYLEVVVYTATYMYLRAGRKEQSKKETTQLIIYSVIAGIIFPITFAILTAYKKAGKERERR